MEDNLAPIVKKEVNTELNKYIQPEDLLKGLSEIK
jgi:hypothetical protein